LTREEINTGADRPGEYLVLLLGLSEILQDLKFPLSVGQKWSYEYRWTSRGAKRIQPRSIEVNVSGVEQVTTPAGSFKAFKIVKQEIWVMGKQAGGGQGSESTTYFYSPDTKSVIKSSYVNENGARREIELIKFGSAPK